MYNPNIDTECILTPNYPSPIPNKIRSKDLLNYSKESVDNNLLIIPTDFSNEVILDLEIPTFQTVLYYSNVYDKQKHKIKHGFRFTPNETIKFIFDLNEKTFLHVRNLIVSEIKLLYAEEPERKLEHLNKWNGIVDFYENLDSVVLNYLNREYLEQDGYLLSIADLSYQIRFQNSMSIPKKFETLFKVFAMEGALN